MHVRTRLIAPPAEFSRQINTFYIIEADAERIEEMIPAYSAQFILMVRGRLRITYGDGRTQVSRAVTINAPMMRSAACVLEGPVTLVGASFMHIAWQAFANLPADHVHDQMVPAEAIMTATQIAALEEAVVACRDGRIEQHDLFPLIGAAIAAGPFAPRADHVAVAEAMLRWLTNGVAPEIGDLYQAVNLSPRQIQRISRRFFGVPPAQVIKRFRALRAAMLLVQPGVSKALGEQLLATYFDQAHLIRDMRRYTGRTPTQWRKWSLARQLLEPAAHGEAGAVLRQGEA